MLLSEPFLFLSTLCSDDRSCEEGVHDETEDVGEVHLELVPMLTKSDPNADQFLALFTMLTKLLF